MSRDALARPILVTGASGFIGACLCRHFAAKGQRVVALHRPAPSSPRPPHSPPARWRLIEDPVASIENRDIDLGSQNDVQALVRELQPSAIVSCAAYGAYPHQVDPTRTYHVNFDAVRCLLEAAREVDGFRAFVQAGSSSEYGSNCSAPREDSAPIPDSDYAVSKVAATAFVQLSGTKRGVPAWVLRLSSVYGPYEDVSRLVPRLLMQARKRAYPPLASPQISRDFVHIDDVCAAFERVIEVAATLPRGEIFNIGTGTCTTLADIVARVRKLFAISEEPVWGSMSNRHWDHPDWYSNPRKANDVLGWRATTSLDDGLARTARWMDENPSVLRAAEANAVTGGA
jgi:nucleoside-diphosphate-sugar epimerase